jgi:hypothetical protein
LPPVAAGHRWPSSSNTLSSKRPRFNRPYIPALKDRGFTARLVIASGGCELETRGVRYQVSAPAIGHDPTRRRFPVFVRIVLRIIGANDFMQLSAARTHSATPEFP